jgi:hypothetical protein
MSSIVERYKNNRGKYAGRREKQIDYKEMKTEKG